MYLSANHQKRKGQSQDSVTLDCYSMGYTPGKLLTLTKSTRQRHHKSKGGNPCSHFRISWDYDTAVIKDRMTSVVKGDHVINTAQKTKRAPYS